MSWMYEDLPWLIPAPVDFRQQCAALDTAINVDGRDFQRLALARLNVNQLIRLSDSLRRARERKADLSPLSPMHLAVIANGTTNLFMAPLPAAAVRHGVNLRTTCGEYDQVMQEALDPASTVNTCKPDAVLLAIDFHGLPLSDGTAGVAGGADAALEQVEAIREGLARGCGAPVILQTISCPPAPMFGNLDRRQAGSLRREIAEYNRGLESIAARRGDYVFDVASLAETVGTQVWHDPTQWNLYKLPFAQKLVPLYVEHLARLLGAIRGLARKCLVLDLDNTLWGGVIGDDGMDGIVIGQGDGTAEAHLDVQRMALALRKRGIILAVCSKNNDDIARQPFREHPDMLLREEHIAVFQANWRDKASNLEAIAKALDIGLDALVFLDDNPAERKQVREALPMVAVPELPTDPSLYCRVLLNAGYFEAVAFTEEDTQRAAQYQANAQRAELASTARNMDDFLASLEMRMEAKPFDQMGLARITQLINKTNQFNLTTRRYTQAEVEHLMAAPDTATLQVRLVDRFGDNGMIGVVICRFAGAEAEIDTWLMSCRVLGRRVEEAMLAEVAGLAQSRGAKRLLGRYIPTAKNGMVSEHYRKLGFAPAGGHDGQTLWRLDLTAYHAPHLPMARMQNSTARP